MHILIIRFLYKCSFKAPSQVSAHTYTFRNFPWSTVLCFCHLLSLSIIDDQNFSSQILLHPTGKKYCFQMCIDKKGCPISIVCTSCLRFDGHSSQSSVCVGQDHLTCLVPESPPIKYRPFQSLAINTSGGFINHQCTCYYYRKLPWLPGTVVGSSSCP